MLDPEDTTIKTEEDYNETREIIAIIKSNYIFDISELFDKYLKTHRTIVNKILNCTKIEDDNTLNLNQYTHYDYFSSIFNVEVLNDYDSLLLELKEFFMDKTADENEKEKIGDFFDIKINQLKDKISILDPTPIKGANPDLRAESKVPANVFFENMLKAEPKVPAKVYFTNMLKKIEEEDKLKAEEKVPENVSFEELLKADSKGGTKRRKRKSSKRKSSKRKRRKIKSSKRKRRKTR